MTFLEQIQANNDPNSEARRKFREMVAPKLEIQSKTPKAVTLTDQDEDGPWGVFPAGTWR